MVSQREETRPDAEVSWVRFLPCAAGISNQNGVELCKGREGSQHGEDDDPPTGGLGKWAGGTFQLRAERDQAQVGLDPDEATPPAALLLHATNGGHEVSLCAQPREQPGQHRPVLSRPRSLPPPTPAATLWQPLRPPLEGKLLPRHPWTDARRCTAAPGK